MHADAESDAMPTNTAQNRTHLSSGNDEASKDSQRKRPYPSEGQETRKSKGQTVRDDYQMLNDLEPDWAYLDRESRYRHSQNTATQRYMGTRATLIDNNCTRVKLMKHKSRARDNMPRTYKTNAIHHPKLSRQTTVTNTLQT